MSEGTGNGVGNNVGFGTGESGVGVTDFEIERIVLIRAGVGNGFLILICDGDVTNGVGSDDVPLFVVNRDIAIDTMFCNGGLIGDSFFNGEGSVLIDGDVGVEGSDGFGGMNGS